MPKVAVITEAHVSAWLARNPRKKRNALKKIPTPKSSQEDITDEFLRNFTPQRLLEALVDLKGKPIDIRWIVRRLVRALEEAERTAEKVMILDRLRELLLLGAIQEPALADEVGRLLVGSGPAPVGNQRSDPFAGRPTRRLKFVD